MTEQRSIGLWHIQEPVTIGIRGPGTPLLTELAFIPIPVPSIALLPFSDYNIPETSWISLYHWRLVSEPFR